MFRWNFGSHHILECLEMRVDTLAKMTSNGSYQRRTEKYEDSEDVKTYFKYREIKLWQNRWSLQKLKLHECEKTVSRSLVIALNRKEQISLRKLRIGHTLITHKYLLEKTDTPKCTTCNSNLRVDHIPTHCPRFAEERRTAVLCDNLKDVPDVDPTNTRRLFLLLFHFS